VRYPERRRGDTFAQWRSAAFRVSKDGLQRDERDRAIVELLGSGVRPSELADVDLGDCRGDSMLVRARKGHKERIVALTENAKTALEVWLPIRAALLEKFKLIVPATPALFLTVSLNRPAKRLSGKAVVQRIVQDQKARLARTWDNRAPLAAASVEGECCSTYRPRERANAERSARLGVGRHQP